MGSRKSRACSRPALHKSGLVSELEEGEEMGKRALLGGISSFTFIPSEREEELVYFFMRNLIEEWKEVRAYLIPAPFEPPVFDFSS